MPVEFERVSVFGGLPNYGDPSQYRFTFGVCSDEGSEKYNVLYHPNVLQCPGESVYVCTDCGECTQEMAKA